MDREELAELWHRNNDRPQWIRENAEALNEHTNLSDPVPEDGSVYQIRAWLDRFKATVTRQLGETPTDADTEDSV